MSKKLNYQKINSQKRKPEQDQKHLEANLGDPSNIHSRYEIWKARKALENAKWRRQAK